MERGDPELPPRMRKVVIIHRGHQALAIRITATRGKSYKSNSHNSVIMRRINCAMHTGEHVEALP